jgi:hypothetical protein
VTNKLIETNIPMTVLVERGKDWIQDQHCWKEKMYPRVTMKIFLTVTLSFFYVADESGASGIG